MSNVTAAIEAIEKLIFSLSESGKSGPVDFFREQLLKLKSADPTVLEDALQKIAKSKSISQYGDFSGAQDLLLEKVCEEALVALKSS